MTYFLHPKGICETTRIGARTRIWAFAHILPGAIIGDDCNICDHVFIENDVTIGDRATIKCGVQLWDGLRIHNDVFIGPNATFINDPSPRSKHKPEEFAPTVIEHNASIGANCTISPGLRIGQFSIIKPGAVVTHSVPPYAIVAGNPAQIVGYATTNGLEEASQKPSPQTIPASQESTIPGVYLKEFPRYQDMRGSLTVGNFVKDIPFTPQRYFMVYAVPSTDVRGEHAHKACEQFLICTNGNVRVVVDNGAARQEFSLDSNCKGLYLPPMTWASQYAYSPDAVLLVFASHEYDANDYIRSYDHFLELTQRNKEEAS